MQNNRSSSKDAKVKNPSHPQTKILKQSQDIRKAPPRNNNVLINTASLIMMH